MSIDYCITIICKLVSALYNEYISSIQLDIDYFGGIDTDVNIGTNMDVNNASDIQNIVHINHTDSDKNTNTIDTINTINTNNRDLTQSITINNMTIADLEKSSIHTEMRNNIKMPYSTVMKNMKEIVCIKEGQKLWLDGNTISIDNSYIQSISRWMNNQSRDNTISKVSETVDSAISYYVSNNEDSNIKNILKKSVKGLQNLTKTYPMKKNELDLLIFEINNVVE